MSAMHTAGPWAIGGELISRAGTATEIASVWSKSEHRRDAPAMPEADANARLIAAAPELLEALERVTALLRIEASKQGEGRYEGSLTMAELALARARGR